MKADYSRASFTEAKAPHDQQCSCQCGQDIKRGSVCLARPFVYRNKVTGHTRIISLEHYDDWLENTAHEYTKTIVDRHPELAGYYGDEEHK